MDPCFSLIDYLELFKSLVHSFFSHWMFTEVACSLTREEILQDWEWLHSNLMTTLTSFDTEEEITEFVCCKIQSIIANSIPDSQFADGRIINRYLNYKIGQCINWVLILFTEEDPESFKTVSFKFHQLFSVPKEDKLVNYYSCRSLNFKYICNLCETILHWTYIGNKSCLSLLVTGNLDYPDRDGSICP